MDINFVNSYMYAIQVEWNSWGKIIAFSITEKLCGMRSLIPVYSGYDNANHKRQKKYSFRKSW